MANKQYKCSSGYINKSMLAILKQGETKSTSKKATTPKTSKKK